MAGLQKSNNNTLVAILSFKIQLPSEHFFTATMASAAVIPPANTATITPMTIRIV